MDARPVFRRCGHDVVPAVLAQDREDAREVHSIERVAGLWFDHANVQPDVVTHERSCYQYYCKNNQPFYSAD